MGKKFTRAKATAEALRRIAKARESSATRLDLAGLFLTTVPPEIGSLTALQALDLRANQLTTVPPEIGSLTALRTLDLGNNQLATVPLVICSLTSLRTLNFYVNRIATLPPEIGSLTALTDLGLGGNQLVALPPEIGSLSMLRELRLYRNQLATLPAEIGSLTALRTLYLHENPALGIPPEVLGPKFHDVTGNVKPKPAAEILAYYFRTRAAEQRRPILEAKVVLVGWGGVGKTSLRRRLVDGTFDPKESQTHKIEITPWDVKVGKDPTRLHVWDFGGQEIMHATHRFFLTERTLYVIVLAKREKMQGAQDAEYWLRVVRSFGKGSPAIVVANKQHALKFELNRQTLTDRYPFIQGFVQTDCEHPELGIDELQRMILREVDKLEDFRTPFDSKWLDIKKAVADLKVQGKRRVTVTQYLQLCAEKGERDEKWQKWLLGFLHKLGAVVCFLDDPRLSDDGVLDPQWVVDGIYKVLNEDALAGGDGQVAAKQVRDLLPAADYDGNDVRLLLELMEKFGLCFRLDDRGETMVVPELMTEQECDWKQEFPDPARGLRFELKYEFLPEGLLPRLIVATHRLSKAGERWRSGVILRDRGSVALIRANSAGVPPTVDITIKGPPGVGRDLLAYVRQEFIKARESFPDLQCTERVPVRGYNVEPLNYDDLISAEDAGERFWPVVVGGKLIKLSLGQLLDGIEPKPQRQARAKHLREISIAKVGTVIIHDGEGDVNFDNHSINARDIINSQVGQTLTNCTNMVKQQPPGEKKPLMEQLQAHVTELIKQLPEDKRDKAEEIAENLEDVLKQSAKEQPNAEKFGISAKGLLEAATWVKDFGGKIGGTILSLGKLAVGAAYVLPKLGM